MNSGIRGGAVELHIEELVLDGFDAGEALPIRDAAERELGRLLGELGLPPAMAQAGYYSGLDAGDFEAERGAPPQAIGQRLAQVLYAGLGGNEPRTASGGSLP